MVENNVKPGTKVYTLGLNQRGRFKVLACTFVELRPPTEGRERLAVRGSAGRFGVFLSEPEEWYEGREYVALVAKALNRLL